MTVTTYFATLLTRRTLLAGGAAAGVGLLAGCRDDSAANPAGGPAAAPTGPDRRLRAAALAEEADLLARYDAALAAHPGLSATLAPIRGEHGEHHRALLASMQSTRPGSGSPSPARPPATAPVVAPVPTDPRAVLIALAAAESSAAASRVDGCLTASRQLAPLLGAIAGSESSHAVVLAVAPAPPGS